MVTGGGGSDTDELLLLRVEDPKYKNYVEVINKDVKDDKKEEEKESLTLVKSQSSSTQYLDEINRETFLGELAKFDKKLIYETQLDDEEEDKKEDSSDQLEPDD